MPPQGDWRRAELARSVILWCRGDCLWGLFDGEKLTPGLAHHGLSPGDLVRVAADAVARAYQQALGKPATNDLQRRGQPCRFGVDNTAWGGILELCDDF